MIDPNPTLPAASPRRHDLDALRAFAMLLGIALHAALSFIPGVWPVTDRYHDDGFGLAVSAVHGFRMPLFFLLSGYFTAMLWRRRGLKALVHHRVKRIVIPMVLAFVTIVPAMNWCIQKAGHSDEARIPTEARDIWTAAASGDLEMLSDHLEQGMDPNTRQAGNPSGPTPLILTAVFDQQAAAELLIAEGADVNAAGTDKGTALHAAAFFGRSEIAALLLQHGADPQTRNGNGLRPVEVLDIDWGTTQFIANLVQLQLDQETLKEKRAEIAELLGNPASTIPSTRTSLNGWIPRLFFTPVFHHLWFLWYLCWLGAGFALFAWAVSRTRWKRPPDQLILSPLRFLWLVPVTLVPQFMMGWMFPTFGADTATGWLPWPPVLLYYAVFFGFGALYQGTDDTENHLGRWWVLLLPLALLVLFPVGMAWVHEPSETARRLPRKLIADILQVSYAWMMCFGFMGMFRRLACFEKPWIRFVSDSSYWLYLAHLPLVILAQDAVRDWEASPVLKFGLILTGVTSLLLVSYRYLVRYRALGTLLNGKRTRPGSITV